VESCRLSLDYWGGAVAYLNGREVARGHLPGGKHDLMALAEDYPLEAFTTPGGKPLPPDDEKNRDRLALRDRKLRDVAIPPALLRKGTNVLAIAVHTAATPVQVVRRYGHHGWPPVGLVGAELTVSPAGAAVANVSRPGGIRVWNCAAYGTVTAFDYGNPAEPLRPIVIRAVRNGVFSGRLMVGSDGPIKGLKVTATDLAQTQGGAKIPAAAVCVRYAEPAVAAKSWAQPFRFDGLLDAIPAEISAVNLPPGQNRMVFSRQVGNGLQSGPWFYHRAIETELHAGVLASLWFTVRVHRDTKPGMYEGTVNVAAAGMKPVTVPLRVSVSEWTVPDPKDFRVHNFIHHSEEALALHYEVPRWSDKHFDLIGRSLALLAEVNSRRVHANLPVEFFGPGGNAESLVRWVRKPDGSFTHDYAVFDRYLDMVARSVGKPFPLRLNCWGEIDHAGRWYGAPSVSLLDPKTGKIEAMPQPLLGSAESLAFWRPVFDEILKKLRARGWLDATALGYSSGRNQPSPPSIVDVAKKLWPEGVWYSTGHNTDLGMKFEGADKSVTMPVRYIDTVWCAREAVPRGYRALLAPRDQFFCYNHRERFSDQSPLTDLRRIAEDMIMSGHDGVGEFGADLFPLKRPAGGYYAPTAGRGMNWNGPGVSTQALLAPGPDGPVATERFEMFREGVELAEALLFIERAIQEKKLSDDLQKRANRYLDERSEAFIKGWFGVRYMQAEEDAKLLGLAGEVARELQK
jgi:hypothetical protein